MKIIDKSKYTSIVYISHPYGGKQDNITEVENIIRRLIEKYPDYLFISPIHSFGFLYDNVGYNEGLNMTLFLLETCADEMWVFGETWKDSDGVMTEIAYCKQRNIPYKIYATVDCVGDLK